MRWLAALLLGTLMAISTPALALNVEKGVSLALAQHRARCISSLEYQLRFEVPAQRSEPIKGQVTFRFDYQLTGQDLQLDFREQGKLLRSLAINGSNHKIRFTEEHIVIPEVALQPGRNTIEIAFTAGDSSLNRKEDFLYTLFVPDRARTAFPLFDQPDLKARYQLELFTPGDWQALGNAPLLSATVSEERIHHLFAPTEPISSYLFSFVAGRFERITREIDGRSMTMLHRETNSEKLERNSTAIFELHAMALRWLEQYTGIPYPFAKLDFALLPAFQYGGMEHAGAIQYRAAKVMLEQAPTQMQLLGRANLIAHEVAHMWFGNLVTMAWFNDVWTKEVFANFMAAKMVNPGFPEIDHELNFLVQHYPGAYQVDRSAGANPIRQYLPNLNQAGQMYGAIIYQKAPIMMRQLERVVGEQDFQQGIRKYLGKYAYGNATWPDLINILNQRSEVDLTAWSEVWVNTAGRPEFSTRRTDNGGLVLDQRDPAGQGRVWPQLFSVLPGGEGQHEPTSLSVNASSTPLATTPSMATGPLLLNADGMGYGLFPAELTLLRQWPQMSELQRGSTLINLYDSLLEGAISPEHYLASLIPIVATEDNALLLDLALDQTATVYHKLLTGASRETYTPTVETALWQRLQQSSDAGQARQLFQAYSALVSSSAGIKRLHALWKGDEILEQFNLSETDRIRLAEILAIRMPPQAGKIIEQQLAQVSNPDERSRLAFIAPSLSADVNVRDQFFASLSDPGMRETESWVVDALRHLHHPSRIDHAEQYLQPSLELLEEIQRSGDIFFPTAWLHANLENHHSDLAVATVQLFLAQRPDYNPQLRLKIEQALDIPLRANRILAQPTQL